MSDDLEFSVDPYDLLQEHDLLLQRLIKAHNETAAHVEQMAANAEQMAGALHDLTHRVKRIEHLVEQLCNTIT